MPMRIGMFSECFEPVQNGVTTSVRTLVDQLRARQHRVVLVAPRYAEYEDGEPFVLRVPSIKTWLNPDYPLAYPWFPRLRRAFGRIAPDVVHSHNPFFVGMLAARLANQSGIPLVSTYHTLYSHYGHYLVFLPDAAVQGLLKWWLPDYYNRCAEVIAPSRVAEDSLRSYGVRCAVSVIPTATPIPDPASIDAEACGRARQRWCIPPDAPLLLHVGRMAQEKNIELVLDAFDQAAQSVDGLRLLVVGGGPHLEALRKRAGAMRFGAGITFAGPVPHDELAPVYAAADLFVFGSSTETQGLVIAEARAAGTPCVVVRGGGASETVVNGEDGVIVDSELGAFTAAVRDLMCCPERRLAMRDACTRNAPRLAPAAMTDRVLEVYERAIASRSAAFTGAPS